MKVSWMMKRANLKNSLTNHDRNEVLCIALYPNTVFNEMWFLTVDPFIRVSVSQSFPSDKTAGVSLRTFIVKNISNYLT